MASPSPFAENVIPMTKKLDSRELLRMCQSYLEEARNGRSSGFEDRDTVWRRNMDAYWSRYDFSAKANWQAKEVIPSVHNSAQRFGSTMRTHLKQSGDWYIPMDPLDPSGLYAPTVKRWIDFFLDRSGTSPSGHTVSFDHTFNAIMVGGAIKMNCAGVTWDARNKRVSIDAIDPSSVWLDPTGRGLYRIRETKLDMHILRKLGKLRDAKNRPIYDSEAIKRVTSEGGSNAASDDVTNDANRMSGGQKEVFSNRKQVRIHEFLCTVLDQDGDLVAENQLVIMANEREIIRGPELNPFWHKNDWIVCAPMVAVPWGVYGRSYLEAFVQLAATFTETTNMILDAVRMSSLNAFMAWPEALDDPSQLNDGIHPNKTFVASEDWPAGQDFLKALKLGQVTPEAFQVWSGIKEMLREAASENEIGLGQLAPKSGTTATEIVSADRGGNQITSNIAADVEATTLAPIVELTWMTSLQHADPTGDKELAQYLGPMAGAFAARRDEFRDRGFKMHVSGLSGLLSRAERGRQLLGLLNVVGSNPLLLQAYQQEYSIPRTLAQLIATSGVDPMTIKLLPNEQPIPVPMEGAGSGDLRQTEIGGSVSGAQG